MTAVNDLIFSQLHSDVALINQLGVYIVNAGGKRMRPLLTVLAARALGYQGNEHLQLPQLLSLFIPQPSYMMMLLMSQICDEVEKQLMLIW